MGRGYSAGRSKSGRPTLRMKRSRSMSLHELKKSVDERERGRAARDGGADEASASASRPASTSAPRKVLKVARQRRAPSSAPPSTVAESRAAAPAVATKAKSAEGRGRSTAGVAGASRSQSAAFRRNLEDMERRFDDAMEASEDEEETVVSTTTMTKYKECGRVVDAVLDELAAACVPGANTKELCDAGDEGVARRLKLLFVKTKGADGKRLTRGLSYPTNISVNEHLCNDSPYRVEEGVLLKIGDVVKLHVGCHLDGYPVSAARTIVVMATAETAAVPATLMEGNEEEEQQQQQQNGAPATLSSSSSRPAVGNTVEAARVALLAMVRALRPGALNADITDLIAAVGHHYGVQAVEGVLSNRTKRWVPDSIDCIIGRRVTSEDPHQDVAECEVAAHQVWCLDVAFTNNHNYRITLAERPETLFRRTPAELDADARVKQANETLMEITDAHQCFPFHFKGLSNPLKAKLGIHVLVRKGVVDKLVPLRTKHGYVTARFSATVAVTAKRVTVLCGAPPTAPVATPPAMRSTVSHDTLAADVCAVLHRPLEFADARAVDTRKGAADRSSPATKRMRVESTTVEEE
ncbi:Metallopeptidase family M24 [Novymonas esmeraldas]|uniref:Metallopeptidase family M24 n=1 Tax=Novymonas esmeraldas TaxID=1808958 RepID=A0AAW0EQT5_9TRYP